MCLRVLFSMRTLACIRASMRAHTHTGLRAGIYVAGGVLIFNHGVFWKARARGASQWAGRV